MTTVLDVLVKPTLQPRGILRPCGLLSFKERGREREVYFPEGPGVDGFKSKTREVTYTYTSNKRRVDIHALEVRMSAVAAKESKSRPSDPWKPEQSQRCPGVSGAAWQRR